ncbi:MAG: hypothetical protein WC551_13485 [Patescibacteria group bacterium]
MDGGTLATYLGTGLAAFFIVIGILFKTVSSQNARMQHFIDSEDENAPGMRRLMLNLNSKQEEIVKAQNAMINQQNLLMKDMAHEVEERKNWQTETRKNFDNIGTCMKDMTKQVNEHDKDIAVLKERNDIVRAIGQMFGNGNGSET